MIGSIWSNSSAYGAYSTAWAQKKDVERQAESVADLFLPLNNEKEAAKASLQEASERGLPVDNNVKATIYAGAVAAGEESSQASGGGGGGGGGEEEKTEIIYKTVVLPDGSKLLQIITKKPDGTVNITTTRVPGAKGDVSGERRETVKESSEGDGEADGATAADGVAESSGVDL